MRVLILGYNTEKYTLLIKKKKNKAFLEFFKLLTQTDCELLVVIYQILFYKNKPVLGSSWENVS